MTTFDDPVAAQRTRDVLTRIMINVLDQERPSYVYGTVTQIDPDLGSCLVLLVGDTVPVRIKFGAMRPAFVGQVVRVSGNRGDRFISDVLGGAVVADVPTSEFTAPILTMLPGYEEITATWDFIGGAARYEVQSADNAAFTLNNISQQVVGNTYRRNMVNEGQLYYFRVRALTSDNRTGPWSATQTATPGSFSTASITDGLPPAGSPQPVVTGALGFLLAEWLPQSNLDTVTYEVHISTVSGFTPSGLAPGTVGATKLGETNGTFYTIRTLGDDTALAYGTTYYVRLIAKDRDGTAAVGAQGAGSMVQIQTGDVGRIATSEIGDGSAPSSSPTPVITNGIGYLYAKWDHVSNADATTYEVHVSTTTGFTPAAGTLVGETPSNFFFIRKQGTSAGSAVLVYGTTYFVKLIAKDVDGQAASGPQGSGTPIQTLTTDIGPNQITTGTIAVGAITAASGILADASVGTAKIIDANITTAKIADLNVSTAKIADLAVSTAKIDNLAVSTAKIGNLAVTDAKIDTLTASKITSGTISATTVTIGASGSIQSSDYVAATSGWKIAVGIAEMNGATVSGSTIIGGTIKTANTGQRIQMDSTNLDRIKFFSGSGSETAEGYVSIAVTSTRGVVLIRTPNMGFGTATMTLSGVGTGGQASSAALAADSISLNAATVNAFGNFTAVGGYVSADNVYSTGALRTTGDYVYADYGGAYETRIGEIYGRKGMYGTTGVQVEGGTGYYVYLSLGNSGYFECNGTYGRNWSYRELSMYGNSILLGPNQGDYNHRVYYNSGFDGVALNGYGAAQVGSIVWDVMAEAGRGGGSVRHVNIASTAWKDSEANAHYSWSDPRAKRNIKALQTRPEKFKDRVMNIQPIEFQWKKGFGIDNPDKLHFGFDADTLPEEAVKVVPMAEGGPAPDSKLMNPVTLLAILWEAVRELTAEVNTLQAKAA